MKDNIENLIIQSLDNLEKLDTIEINKDFEICKMDSVKDVPLVVFDKKKNKYYVFETIIDIQLENWELNFEWILYWEQLKEYKCILIYNDVNYLVTAWEFDINWFKYIKDKIKFWTYFWEEWAFYFDAQRYHKDFHKVIFDKSIYDDLINDYLSYCEKKWTKWLVKDTELNKAQKVFNYISNNYKYSWYMAWALWSQKTFDKYAHDKPIAFFLPEILKSKECVCQSYSQMFLMLCYFEWLDNVDTIFKFSIWWVNHVRNRWIFDWKYYFIDLTCRAFKEIDKTLYKWLDNEVFSWMCTLDS